MGKRGPRPKPTALRVLEGNPSNRPLPKNEPKPVAGSALSAPATLDVIGRGEWRRLAPQLHLLGLLTDVDRSALEAYCQIYSELRHLRAQRRRLLRNPATRDANWADGGWRVDSALDRKGGLYRQYLAEFGLTPAARTRVEADDPPAQPVKGTGTDGKALGRFFRE